VAEVNKPAMLNAAEVFDAWRAVPRLLIIGYGYMLWRINEWAMSLPDMSTPQTIYVGTVWGAAAVFVNAYLNTGRKWQQ
jgi:hypothetical protein